ncbi:hypothetical protein PsorP6_003280 [Peronosclerospora sorghi]|uniref:Uncharacterized protein n=1 Tax=Peronosclerospora sorghi TaxID=230839 RepID=A0ACC0VQP3_9STRA|nr:hypothetical protein PsorP6_003280 [Peronosclerospora sorghi]
MFAFSKVHEQFLIFSRVTTDNPLSVCSGEFKQSMGLPCAHVIHTRLTAGQQLQIGDFHEHWWIKDEMPQQDAQGEPEATVRTMLQTLEERYQLWPAHRQATFRSPLTQMVQDNDPILQNPLVQRTRGRPVGARNRPASSTRRDLDYRRKQATEEVRNMQTDGAQ